jgi:hypothetical protein
MKPSYGIEMLWMRWEICLAKVLGIVARCCRVFHWLVLLAFQNVFVHLFQVDPILNIERRNFLLLE